MNGPLAGRTVLVTGGNRGIGLGLAHGVAAAGASVVVWGRDTAANAAAVSQLRQHGGQAAAVACDVGDPAAVEAAFVSSLELTGRVDAVFANAAAAAPYKPFHEQTDEDWARVLRVNLGGVVSTARAAVRHMLARDGGGALVVVGSMAARTGMRWYSPYATGKAAVVGLVRSVAVDHARHGIRANALLPGWIDTDMTAATPPALREQVTRRTPAGRFGVPDDFAAAAVFLADPGNPYHTGDVVVVDGGYLAV